jgi:hypothetical protein
METTKLSPVDSIKPTPPGISWTAPAKGRPWMTPPKFTKVSDIAQGYIDNLSSDTMMNSILDVIETEVPLAAMAEAIMLSSVNKGVHTLDAGILVMPVIIEMLKTAADVHNYKYVVFPDELEKDTTVPPRIVKKAVEQAMKEEEPTDEVVVPQVNLTGLMARNKRGIENGV